jgi:hypothetical protein
MLGKDVNYKMEQEGRLDLLARPYKLDMGISSELSLINLLPMEEMELFRECIISFQFLGRLCLKDQIKLR